jgi:hypothetical protein
MKGEKMMVCHFYRNSWPCKVMDMHLDMLSKKHIGGAVYNLNPVDPQLESAWFQPLSLDLK